MSSWAHPPPAPSVEAAQDQLKDLIDKITHHNQYPPDTTNPAAVAAYNNEADFYNAWAAQLNAQLDTANTPYTPATSANRADVSGWTQPAPPHPELPDPPSAGPHFIDEVPLQTSRQQIESKYDQHAGQFGVDDPRGTNGFDKWDTALRQVVDNPATVHIDGTYRGQRVILNYNPDSGLCVIQDPSGGFISGWKLGPDQAKNVIKRGSL